MQFFPRKFNRRAAGIGALLLLWLSSCSVPTPPLGTNLSSQTPSSTVPTHRPTDSPETPPLFVTITPSATLFSTPTIPPTPTASPTREPPVRFAIIGDYGLAGDNEYSVASLVKSWDPDFILTTGDNNYPDGAAETIDQNIGQYYHEYIHPYYGSYGPGAEQNFFFPTLGNHDYTTANAQPYLDYFQLPGNERYYDFEWGSLHFFALNSDYREVDGIRADSRQAAWLQERMTVSQAPWQIVYFHAAPYSSGVHGSSDWMRWPFQEWGADAVIAGHDHTYERLDIGGVPYFVNGLGGGARYDFEEVLPESLVRFNEAYGAMLVETTSEQIIFRFITVQGQEIDHFVLEAAGDEKTP